jgi:hypothetical protein
MTTIDTKPLGPTSLSPSPDVSTADAPPPASILPPAVELQCSGDIGAMIAGLLLENGYRQRDLARAAREAALESEAASDDARLQHMEEAASARFDASLTKGLSEVSAGAATCGAGFMDDEVAARKVEGPGKASAGVGAVGAAFLDREAAIADQGAQRDDNASKAARRMIETATDADKDGRALIEKALDLYKQYVTAKDDAQKAAILRA